MVALKRSVTIGLQPPQPVDAFVLATTSSIEQHSPVSTGLQISPFEIASQEQICAESGNSVTEPRLEFSPPRFPKIRSSGLLGSFIALMYI